MKRTMQEEEAQVELKRTKTVHTKKKATAEVLSLGTMDVTKDILVSDIFNGNCKMAKITSKKGGVCLVYLEGGGRCSKICYDGDEKNLYGEGILLPLDNEQEAKLLTSVGDHLLNQFHTNHEEWFGDKYDKNNVDLNHRKLVAPAAPKKKLKATDPDGFWPANIKASAKNADIEAGLLNIVDEDGNTLPPSVLNEQGTRWTKAVLEIKSVYASGKMTTGISKRWRRVQVKVAEHSENLEIEFPTGPRF